MDNKSWATRNRNVYAFFFVQYQEICYNRWEQIIMKKIMQ